MSKRELFSGKAMTAKEEKGTSKGNEGCEYDQAHFAHE